MKALISEGAKERLFKIYIKASDRLENCDSGEEYESAKARAQQWHEIVIALGLLDEFGRYYAEKRERNE